MAEVAKVKSRAGRAVMRGSLTLAIGNPAAVNRNARGATDHADLNRRFGELELAEPEQPELTEGAAERERAALLAPLLASTDILIDLHATNKPSPPFIRVAGPFEERHMAACSHFFGPDTCSKLVLDPHHALAGRPVTTDEFVGKHGGVGICYETGQAADMRVQMGARVRH
eukprot:g4431.t1